MSLYTALPIHPRPASTSKPHLHPGWYASISYCNVGMPFSRRRRAVRACQPTSCRPRPGNPGRPGPTEARRGLRRSSGPCRLVRWLSLVLVFLERAHHVLDEAWRRLGPGEGGESYRPRIHGQTIQYSRFLSFPERMCPIGSVPDHPLLATRHRVSHLGHESGSFHSLKECPPDFGHAGSIRPSRSSSVNAMHL